VKPSRSLLKFGAIVSAILLVGGFVGYRAGAISWVMGTSPPPTDAVMGGSKFKTIHTATPSQPDTLLPGSKYDLVIQPPAQSQPAGDARQADETFMGGSKTLVFPVIPPKQPGTPPPAPAQPPTPPK
jgi:hypothetical protein